MMRRIIVATRLDQARDVLARANRIIANEGVLDAFGHVSMVFAVLNVDAFRCPKLRRQDAYW